MKLDKFYNLLVKEMNEESENANSGDDCIFVENRRDVIEISQSFLKKATFYWSYVARAVVELTLALIVLSWLCVYGLPETIEVSFKKWGGPQINHFLNSIMLIIYF